MKRLGKAPEEDARNNARSKSTSIQIEGTEALATTVRILFVSGNPLKTAHEDPLTPKT